MLPPDGPPTLGEPQPPPAPKPTSGRLAALDGLRGLALIGMLAWHAQLDWVKGGFARMTIFFVLSGYLATTSLLRLRGHGHRRPSLVFIKRRARRLLPLTLLGVAAAIAVTLAVGSVAARQELQGDAISVLTSVSNWRFIAGARSYGALFESPSAFQHFWSLSAEEQCIWLLPLVLAGLMVITRRRSWAPVALVAAGLLAIPAVVTQSPDTIYYGTPNRAGEFLAGAALALWLASRTRPLGTSRSRELRWLGAVSLASLVAVMALVDRSTPWLYQGGLALVVVPVLGVVVAVIAGGGPAVFFLSARPLVALGRWALSIYALHWPLFVLMGDGRIHLSGASLAIVEITVAVLMGGIIHVLVERPLLPRRQPSGSPAMSAGANDVPWWSHDRALLPILGAVSVGLVVVALMIPSPPPTYDFVAAQQRANNAPASAGAIEPGTPMEGATPVGLDLPDGKAHLGVFGGSTAVLLGASLWDWAADNASAIQPSAGSSRFGCGLLTEGTRLAGTEHDGESKQQAPEPECLDWETEWPRAVSDNNIQVALVVTGVWETSDWVLDETSTPSSIGDPSFDALLRAKVERAIDDLSAAGARVIIATAPNVGPGTTGQARAKRGLPEDHPDRVARYNALLRGVVAARADATLVDYGDYIDSFSTEESAVDLPDGIHPNDSTTHRIWDDFLGPNVLRAVYEHWPELTAEPTDELALAAQ